LYHKITARRVTYEAVPLGSLGTGFVLAGLSDLHLAPNWWA